MVLEALRTITSPEFLLAGVYIGLAVMGWRIVLALNRNDNNWNATDLLSDSTGKASLAHVLQAVGSVTMTWAFLYFTFQRSLTDAYVAVYAAYHAALYGVNKFSAPPTGGKPNV